MKRLLYISKVNFAKPANKTIIDKITGQIDGFESYNFNCDLLYTHNQSIKLKSKTKESEITSSNKLHYLYILYYKVYKQFLQVSKYDYIYIRHWFMNPLFLISLKVIKQANPACKIFMEIPTYPYDSIINTKTINGKISLWGDQFSRSFFKNTIEKIITFTDYPKIYNIPTINIANGVHSKNFKKTTNSIYDGSQLRLLAIANLQPWHGYDRIVKGLNNYIATANNLPIHIDIIGDGPDLFHLKELSSTLKLSKNITFHGRLNGPALHKQIERAHIGIGSLGLHRIQSDGGQVSTLKSREYAANGLPFIKAHKDRVLDNRFPYMYTFPNNDEPIDLSALVKFYADLDHSNLNAKIKHYAKMNFGWNTIVKDVIAQYLS